MSKARPQPCLHLDGLKAYRPPRAKAPTDLRLDANEGPPPPPELLALLREVEAADVHRYRSSAPLEKVLADRVGLDPAQVMIGAGADEVIDRLCRVYVQPDREVIVPTPTFEMICHLARVSGGRLKRVAWTGEDFPVDDVCAAVTPETGLIVVISPNNPTGLAVRPAELVAVAEAAPHAVVLVDLAYAAYADEDLLGTVLRLPNAVAVNTLSKTEGLAGLRLGYAISSPEMLQPMRLAGGPFPVSNLSRAVAERWLVAGRSHIQWIVARVRSERETLQQLLAYYGAVSLPSQANFVFARFTDNLWVRDAMAGFGIAVRLVPATDGFAEGIRISCPADAAGFARLCAALATVLSPEALLFDMDGVLADVSRSYRRAIVETAATFGVQIGAEDVAAAKAAGGANDDWELTRRLLAERGVEVDLPAVKECFKRLYQGDAAKPGLCAEESLLPERALLERFAERLPLAIVTGRPREDAERFLAEHDVADLFAAVVCREDGPLKPNPAPLRVALEKLGVDRAWFIGDTTDDISAARHAGALPLGVQNNVDTAAETAMYEAGAARVLTNLRQLEDLLP
ncbi:MAG: TIGR01548 family HAD-type hydrolase [Candidatus Lernaella stagnicola]|nr:TIGR01548 family HAD-type hydrolase [Candidatus Lernaella stagnicola]